MTNTVANSFVTQWNSEVHHLFQQKGSKLREAVRTVSGVVGSTHKFHTLGSVVANTKSRNANVTLLNPAHDVATATLADAYAPIMIDKLDQLKTNADFRREYVQTAANALGRKVDDMIISALDTDGGNTIGTTAGGLTYTKILQVIELLNEKDVPAEDRYFVVSPKAVTQALGIEELTSQDYVTVSNVMSGTVGTALGLKWIMSSRLNTSGSPAVRDCYGFARNAVGLAIGQDIVTAIDPIPEKVSFLINSYLSMGAVVIESDGVAHMPVSE